MKAKTFREMVQFILVCYLHHVFVFNGTVFHFHFKRTAQHFGKYAFSLSCQELDKKIKTILQFRLDCFDFHVGYHYHYHHQKIWVG